jgi:predicted short-subunit dehydrogenase-like oxidoreductase (DUF2520 family)
MNVFIAGSGNAATCLGLALHAAGHRLEGLWSRNGEKASALAARLGTHAVGEGEIPESAELVLLCLADDALHELPPWLAGNWMLVHTSGSVPMQVLNTARHHGVLYPLQTLSALRETPLARVPLCVEGSDAAAEQALLGLAQSVSSTAVVMNSEQRRQLHLAAVFTNNFANHMFAIGAQLARHAQADPALLGPLMQETAAKAAALGAEEAQTGPALRGDRSTLARHLDMLAGFPAWKQIYQHVSSEIYRHRYGKEL